MFTTFFPMNLQLISANKFNNFNFDTKLPVGQLNLLNRTHSVNQQDKMSHGYNTDVY